MTDKKDEKVDKNKENEEENKVTPWEVKGKVKYDKLVEEFGTQLITDELIERFEKVTKKPVHPWIKRGLFFCHRDLNLILDAYEKGEQIFLYTGRGPTSDALHLGHLIPFMFTKWLQDVFDCYLVIQLSDDEKFYFKDNKFKEIYKLGRENAKDIIAVGFNPQKTFIFSNRDYRLCTPKFEEVIAEINKSISFHSLVKIFGFNEQSNVGMIGWPSYQIGAAFSDVYPHLFRKKAYCLIPYAIDQDPYFRLSRDVAKKLKLLSPCSIIGKFIPPLTGSDGKMSSSISQQSTIFLTDDEKAIKHKILKYSFSGGGGDGSLKDHKLYGGNVDADIPCQYLKFFELDDEKLNKIFKEFKEGKLTCGDTKNLLVEKLVSIVLEHQKRRSQVTEDDCDLFYAKDKAMYKNIISPFDKKIPAFSYPGMTLPYKFMDVITKNIPKQLNAIGTHTRSENTEDGFEEVHEAEREYIYWIGQHLFKTSKNIKEDIDGYIASGATEGNIMGLWILRNKLLSEGVDLNNIHLVFSKLAHYSIVKASNILNLRNCESVDIDTKFRIDYNKLEELLEKLLKEEKNRVILALTIGTTLSGSIDKVIKINKLVSEKYKNKVLIHLDAAFGGFILPFSNTDKKYFFENENVYTIGLDAHKTGNLPFPTGIFLCRKNLQKFNEIKVDYIYGSHDDTLIGSRNGVFSLLGKWYVHNFGEDGQRRFVEHCLEGKKKLVEEIKKEVNEFIELYHSPKNINQICFSFKNMTEEQIKKCEDILMLRHYNVNGKKIYKVPVMPHTVNAIKSFVQVVKTNSKK